MNFFNFASVLSSLFILSKSETFFPTRGNFRRAFEVPVFGFTDNFQRDFTSSRFPSNDLPSVFNFENDFKGDRQVFKSSKHSPIEFSVFGRRNDDQDRGFQWFGPPPFVPKENPSVRFNDDHQNDFSEFSFSHSFPRKYKIIYYPFNTVAAQDQNVRIVGRSSHQVPESNVKSEESSKQETPEMNRSRFLLNGIVKGIQKDIFGQTEPTESSQGYNQNLQNPNRAIAKEENGHTVALSSVKDVKQIDQQDPRSKSLLNGIVNRIQKDIFIPSEQTHEHFEVNHEPKGHQRDHRTKQDTPNTDPIIFNESKQDIREISRSERLLNGIVNGIKKDIFGESEPSEQRNNNQVESLRNLGFSRLRRHFN